MRVGADLHENCFCQWSIEKLGFRQSGRGHLDDRVKNRSKNSQRFFSFTNGKQGSVLFHKKRNYESNVLAENLLDTTGCGDAFFVISSILINSKMNLNFIPILSNIYAGLHGNFLGNEKIVSKEEYLKLIKTLSRI